MVSKPLHWVYPLTASVYHPTLKKMVKLTVMEAEGESEEHVATFWKELNEVIKEVSGDRETSFNPYEFMLDEACINCFIKFGNVCLIRIYKSWSEYKRRPISAHIYF